MASNNKTKDDKYTEIYNVDFNKIDTLDKFYSLTQQTGSIDKAISNNLYGINHQAVKNIIPANRDSYGYVFFTRPQLNMSSYNLRNLRHFYSLLTTDHTTIQRYVRCTLDPRINIGKNEKITSPLVDPSFAFIPVLSNNIKTMSGWPDIVLPTYSSKQGVRREQTVMADGTTDIYDSFDIDCVFRNTKDEPIILMMQTWLYYAAAVFEGVLTPYVDMITENMIDYNTRIYRLVMDESKRVVKKIAATGASFPINVPTGKFFDYDDSAKYNDQAKDINIRFKSVGAMYNDDILVREFNETTLIFNRGLEEVVTNKYENSASYEKIPEELLSVFNHRGYPLINTNTFELNWWVNKNSATYKDIQKTLTKTSSLN